MTARRELRLTVALCLLGAGLVLFATSRPWASLEDGSRLTIDAVRTSVPGRRIVPGATALGLVGLAGVVALAATRRWGRRLVGLLVLLAGASILVTVSRVLANGLSVSLPDQVRRTCSPSCTGLRTFPGLAWLCLIGGFLLLLAGLLALVRGRRWATLSDSYETPAARTERAPVTDKGVWDALDRGEDPTG